MSDYKAWIKAYSAIKPPRNMWDFQKRRVEQDHTKDDFKEILKGMKESRDKDESYRFGVFKKNGEFIGIVVLWQISRAPFHTAQIGYRLFNNHWGNGYGAEATKASAKMAFKELNLHRLEALIGPSNRRSISLIKSLGFKREGLKKKALLSLSHGWMDFAVYAAFSEDFGIKFKPKDGFK